MQRLPLHSSSYSQPSTSYSSSSSSSVLIPPPAASAAAAAPAMFTSTSSCTGQEAAAAKRRRRSRHPGRPLLLVACCSLAFHFLPELQLWDMVDGEALTFTQSPLATSATTSSSTRQQGTARLPPETVFVRGGLASALPEAASKRPSLRSAAAPSSVPISDASTTIWSRIIAAMGAGAVASVIQAGLSAVGEPIVNRVLVKRMKVGDAIRDVKPAMMVDFFKTTLATNFLKFPFFEAINAFCATLPLSPTWRGVVTGIVFTSATLPVTNYRYRKSMQLEVNWANIYEAYWPTVLRDIVYGIVRNYATIWTVAANPTWTNRDPQVLFIVVILGCLGSAPFNEWRGFLLQSKGQRLSFGEFFRPSNFLRSTLLGALKQGLALAAGYWCAPPATQWVHRVFHSVVGPVEVSAR